MKVEENKIRKITEGIFGNVVDFLLWEIAYIGLASTTFSKNTWEPRVKADKFLEQVNYETIKYALAKARQKKLIKSAGGKRVWPEITEEGEKRLKEIIPHYDSKRIWDKKIYLVTYDIPEKKKKARELLRGFLKRLGCGMIQESVWLTPYNPKEVLKEFIEERELSGNILISDIGEDGSIGEEDLKTLIARIYYLDEINEQYREFIRQIKEGNSRDRAGAIFQYLSILKEDPQLPFSLLPDDWKSERAHKLYKKYAKSICYSR